MDFLNVLTAHSSYIYGVAIVGTIIALVISTRYSLRNLLNIHAADDVFSNESKTSTNDLYLCDATGNDGDDEADPDEDLTGQQISSHCPDPLGYYEHIQGKIKYLHQSVTTRTIEQSLTENKLLKEKEAQCSQLAEIFRLMQEQQDHFGIDSMDDMHEQMKLYGV